MLVGLRLEASFESLFVFSLPRREFSFLGSTLLELDDATLPLRCLSLSLSLSLSRCSAKEKGRGWEMEVVDISEGIG